MGEAIRDRVRRIGPVYRGYNPRGGDKRQLGDVATYRVSVRGRDYDWKLIHHIILMIYALDKDAWTLKEYLWANTPTRSQFLIARPHLMYIWRALTKENDARGS